MCHKTLILLSMCLMVFIEKSSAVYNPAIRTGPKFETTTYPTTLQPAFRCSRQTDCRIAANTSCVRTQYDSATKCLCADNQPPINGLCQVKINKALHHICNTADDCAIELICKPLNFTAELPSYLRVFTPLDKVCQCDTANGYEEHDFMCSGTADIANSSVFAILLIAALKKVFA